MSALEQWLLGLLLEHDVSMLQAEAEEKAKVLALLVTMQKDIVGLLANAPNLSEMGKADKNALLRESNAMIEQYYGKAQLGLDLGLVGEVEALGVRQALSTVLEARIGVELPTENYLRTLASDTLIQGSPAKGWWLRQEQDVAFKLANEIRVGAAQGETNAKIIARVVGNDEVPGVMPMARKNAAAVVQTSMQTVAATARRKMFELNSDIMTGIMQVSTLDGHTSQVCIAYSGATWDLNYEPSGDNDLPYNGGVPRHWNCRSSEVPIMKTYAEMGIPLDEPAEGTRASETGPVSAKTTFADYLKMRGPEYQDEVLGKGKAELFRSGKLTPRDLVDMNGNPVSLERLREKYGHTFSAPSGQFTIYDPGFARVAPDVSTPARAAAVKFEDTIRRNSHETGAFFGSDGKLLMARSGEPDRVSFSGADLVGTKGSLFTHNHPGGGSFSLADVKNASALGLSELRAVAPDYRHIMTPATAWPSEAVIQRAYDAELGAAYRDVSKMVSVGELSVKYATTEIQHLQWTRAAAKLGLVYNREAS